ncbi:MAG: hypothetical protein MZW92_09575 [Comamonadaceae bacterium]|nr:hypothetical protein [Comamonadaceae bacterium]
MFGLGGRRCVLTHRSASCRRLRRLAASARAGRGGRGGARRHRWRCRRPRSSMKLLAERLELETRARPRASFGVLLFQDLAVVPLLVLIPALAAPAASACWSRSAGRCVKAAVVLAAAAGRAASGCCAGGCTLVARRKSRRAVHAQRCC